MSKVPSVSLLLVGRDGNGKSSTGNSILGDKKHFNPTSSSSSAGLEIKQASVTVGDDREVTVTEIAGLEYPGSDYTGNFEEDTLKRIGETIEKNQQGFNAIIFVLKYGTRFTKQEKDALQIIKSIFGFNVLKKFGVIVMTCGDSFELDVEEDKQTFEEWCRAQTGDVKDLFEDCNNRCVLFNNRTKDPVKMEGQRDKLFSQITHILHPYTLKEYKEAVKDQTEILVQIKLPQLEQYTNKIMNKAWEALNEIDGKFSKESCNILELSTSLKNIQTKLLDLKKHLEEEDKNTGVLKQLFCAISIAEMRIDTKLKIAEQRLQVVAPSGTWVIVDVHGFDFCLQDITETVSIRKCTLDGAGKFNSSFLSEDVTGCGIDLLEICKTSPKSQQVTKTLSLSNTPSCDEKVIVVISQNKGGAQEKEAQTSAVLDYTGHDKPDNDLVNTKIIFETIGTILKEHKIDNAFCLISKYSNKFIEQEIIAVMMTINAFGSSVINQGILILTYDNDDLEMETDKMFKVWCQEETGTNQKLLDLCGKRCVLLNPWIKDEGALTAQKKKLFSLIWSVAGADNGNASENAEFEANNAIQPTESAISKVSKFFHVPGYKRKFFSNLFS